MGFLDWFKEPRKPVSAKEERPDIRVARADQEAFPQEETIDSWLVVSNLRELPNSSFVESVSRVRRPTARRIPSLPGL
ncbi:MAG: hypothetical protein KAW81_02600 [Dehalococcoidia bacterium]|nr:hypothetical protein [Dehalococcoidia bacterium]